MEIRSISRKRAGRKIRSHIPEVLLDISMADFGSRKNIIRIFERSAGVMRLFNLLPMRHRIFFKQQRVWIGTAIIPRCCYQYKNENKNCATCYYLLKHGPIVSRKYKDFQLFTFLCTQTYLRWCPPPLKAKGGGLFK